MPFLLWSGIALFLTKLGSRRQLGFALNTPNAIRNLNALAATHSLALEHPDTLAVLLKRVSPPSLAAVLPQMVGALIRSRRLEDQRLFGSYLVAVDGSGQLSFKRWHCEHCLHQTSASGTTRYLHEVLDAKLVTPSGLALPLATEFIENRIPGEKKQDCEIKAFYRLAPQVKAFFPQLPLTFLFDALYAKKPVLELCRTHEWHFIITFKEGSIPSLWTEFKRLRDLSPHNHLRVPREDGVVQEFRWVAGLDHMEERVNALECREADRGGNVTTYVWLTDFPVNRETVELLANRGGRLRWKIENEGFNAQKNGGYGMEHAYCEHANAAKNFYYLLQIAHLINQVLQHSNLVPDPKRRFGSLRAFTGVLLESLRGFLIPESALDPEINRHGQVRFAPT